MTFEEFTDYVKDHVLDHWNEGASVEVQTVYKNNCVKYTPLYIRKEGQMAVPSVYLENFYYQYRHGISLENILVMIRKEYEDCLRMMPKLDWNHFNFGYVEDRIIYRLINYDKNKEILEDCPYIRLDDLAVTFRWLAHSDETGISSALVSNKEMEAWNITPGDLLCAAQRNTPKFFPVSIHKIEEAIQLLSEEKSDLGDIVPMYILTNDKGVNGASCLLYDHVIEDFAEDKQCGLYILPSSIHELIIIPETEVEDPDILSTIVRDANNTVVELGDILSYSVYYYDIETKRLSIYDYGKEFCY